MENWTDTIDIETIIDFLIKKVIEIDQIPVSIYLPKNRYVELANKLKKLSRTINYDPYIETIPHGFIYHENINIKKYRDLDVYIGYEIKIFYVEKINQNQDDLFWSKGLFEK